MQYTQDAFINELKALIQEKHLLDHPFYQMWNAGELTKEHLARYAEQYYHLESNFPVFLSHMHTVSGRAFDVRQTITDNMYDEEHGDNNHRELWLRFGEGMGTTRDAMQTCEAITHTQASVNSLKEITSTDYLSAAGALAAYEDQMPAVSESKIDGLETHYHVTDEATKQFFRVHGEMDKEHAAAWWSIIDTHATTDELRQKVREGVVAGRDALWHFLDGIVETYVPECSMV